MPENTQEIGGETKNNAEDGNEYDEDPDKKEVERTNNTILFKTVELAKATIWVMRNIQVSGGFRKSILECQWDD